MGRHATELCARCRHDESLTRRISQPTIDGALSPRVLSRGDPIDHRCPAALREERHPGKIAERSVQLRLVRRMLLHAQHRDPRSLKAHVPHARRERAAASGTRTVRRPRRSRVVPVAPRETAAACTDPSALPSSPCPPAERVSIAVTRGETVFDIDLLECSRCGGRMRLRRSARRPDASAQPGVARSAGAARPGRLRAASPHPARAARAAAGPLQARARAARRGGNTPT